MASRMRRAQSPFAVPCRFQAQGSVGRHGSVMQPSMRAVRAGRARLSAHRAPVICRYFITRQNAVHAAHSHIPLTVRKRCANSATPMLSCRTPVTCRYIPLHTVTRRHPVAQATPVLLISPPSWDPAYVWQPPLPEHRHAKAPSPPLAQCRLSPPTARRHASRGGR